MEASIRKLRSYLNRRRNRFDKRRFRDLVRQQAPVIVDVGAYDGQDACELSQVFPSAIIHAIEANPEIYPLLLATAERCSIKPYNVALGDSNGQNEFFVSSGRSAASSSLRKPKLHLEVHPDILFSRRVTVRTQRLDDWAAENGIERIDILWLDTQGTEFEILNSGPRILSTVQVIHAEVAFCEMYEGQALYPQVRSFLESRGFSLYEELFGYSDMGNAVFVSSR